jgi:hypothetical protein
VKTFRHVLPVCDEACLQRVLGVLLTSKSLRERLLVQGIGALRQDPQLGSDITPGAWRALRDIAPRTYADLAFALERNQARHRTLPDRAPSPKHSDAA